MEFEIFLEVCMTKVPLRLMLALVASALYVVWVSYSFIHVYDDIVSSIRHRWGDQLVPGLGWCLRKLHGNWQMCPKLGLEELPLRRQLSRGTLVKQASISELLYGCIVMNGIHQF